MLPQSASAWCLNPRAPPQIGMYMPLASPRQLTGDSGLTGLPLFSPLAAAGFFAQGVAQEWNFNQHEALRNFEHVVELSPECAICWWGVARARGSNINRAIHDQA